jgi:hypothetical protein
MPHFLVEIHMNDADQREVARAVEMLEAAQARSPKTGKTMPAIIAGFSREDGRLVCLIDATSLESARRLVSVALLPAGRIREITPVTGRHLVGARHPGGDIDPGVEPELVEDVVDVGLDGSLGQE